MQAAHQPHPLRVPPPRSPAAFLSPGTEKKEIANMSAKKEKAANFRTYEAQARLLAAVVASLPKNFRFDYKTIAKYFGGRTTESAIEHRFRPLRAQADALREMVPAGADPMDFPVFDWKTAKDIQKYFGESTQEGIAFQFRWIKKSAEVCKTAADNGGSPVEAFRGLMESGNGSRAAVASAGPAVTPSAKRARAASKTATTPASKRRKAQEPAEAEDDSEAASEHALVLSSVDEEESSSDVDFSAMDATPTKAKPKAAAKTTKNVSELVPRVDKEAAAKPTSRQLPTLLPCPAPALTPTTAAAPPRPSLASRPALPAVPNGFTNPATGLAFHEVPRQAATPSSANTPAAASSPAATTSLDAMRRSSVVTIDSSSSASRPITPNDMAQYAATFPFSAPTLLGPPGPLSAPLPFWGPVGPLPAVDQQSWLDLSFLDPSFVSMSMDSWLNVPDSSSTSSSTAAGTNPATHGTSSRVPTAPSPWSAYAPDVSPAPAAAAAHMTDPFASTSGAPTMPGMATGADSFATTASAPSFSASAHAADDDDESFFAFMNRDAVVESAPQANFGGFRADVGEEEDEDAGAV
ncbi:hypothetical protein VTJ49DRAFT_6201 [Mycothermus thermophilus]|uniref:Proteophosphoglycan ppg4 n=1 Tax=Humicola insolens TaxID=85995 RepID=A0ABR3V1X2_HUMIN